MVITLTMARKMRDAAMKHAEEIGKLCSVAIVDDDGRLIAIYRMDAAPIATADIAWSKAWTAAAFKLPSSEVYKFGNPPMPGFGFNVSNWNDRLTTIAGGLPIKDGDKVVGGIGVSGGTPEEDVIICQEAIKSIDIE
jgi:uncharacterized protein GlcG (DUF336 family)